MEKQHHKQDSPSSQTTDKLDITLMTITIKKNEVDLQVFNLTDFQALSSSETSSICIDHFLKWYLHTGTVSPRGLVPGFPSDTNIHRCSSPL